MENKITVDTKYYYDSSCPLTYEELKRLGVGAIVWCEYSEGWACNVKNEIKTIIEDFYSPTEIDLRGSFCCIGNLKKTMERSKVTIKVYELKKTP